VTQPELGARLRAMFAEELDDQLRVANASLIALEKSPSNGDELRSLFRVMHTLKGAARAASLPSIEQLCHRLEALLASARDSGRALTREELATLFAGVDRLSAETVELRGANVPPDEIEPATPDNQPTEMPRDAAIRIGQDRVNELFGITNRIVTAVARAESQPEALDALHETANRAASLWRRLRHRLDQQSESDRGLSRDVAALDDALTAIRRSSISLLGEALQSQRDLQRLATEASLGVRALRLRPFADAIEDLPRLVRDVAAATGKDVRIETHGEDVNADRVVLAHIRDALLHLVRNAIDHGIEDPDVRRARGKPQQGLINVSAGLIGDRIVVTVQDDGAGIDVAAIRRQLVARGEAGLTDDRSVARRLFLGGVSTRGTATDISGRGVGLDAVRAAADAIRGSVEVDWVTGVGTTLTIEAPLTMATVRAVIARSGNATVAIPAAYIERLMRVSPESLRTIDGRFAIETGAAPAFVASVAGLLGPPLVDRPIEGPTPIALVCVGERQVALRVDEMIEEHEVVVRPIRAHGREAVPHISGAALLPEGSVALVLNMTTVVASALRGTGGLAAVAEKREIGEKRRRVLVVDDSITTRTLEASVLEAAGYDVATAVDGADAWRVLQERGADLVVSDVEMPRMDGLQLCETIRGSQRFKNLPVVLVTALETAEHRMRGLEVGADAYLAKSSFDQEGLLTTIRDLLGARRE
jgi:two-component system chemotaxis sensor kinase CheA